MDVFIRVCGGEFRHLVLFDNGLFDKTFNKFVNEFCYNIFSEEG